MSAPQSDEAFLRPVVREYMAHYGLRGCRVEVTNHSFLQQITGVEQNDERSLTVTFSDKVARTHNSEAHGGVRDFVRSMLVHAPMKPKIDFAQSTDYVDSYTIGNAPTMNGSEFLLCNQSVRVRMEFLGAADADWAHTALQQLIALNREKQAADRESRFRR